VARLAAAVAGGAAVAVGTATGASVWGGAGTGSTVGGDGAGRVDGRGGAEAEGAGCFSDKVCCAGGSSRDRGWGSAMPKAAKRSASTCDMSAMLGKLRGPSRSTGTECLRRGGSRIAGDNPRSWNGATLVERQRGRSSDVRDQLYLRGARLHRFRPTVVTLDQWAGEWSSGLSRLDGAGGMLSRSLR
jgi:hypothetical protein